MRFAEHTESLDERVARYRREVKPYHDYYQNWHPYFAHKPVPISSEEKVVGEWLERKFTWGSSVNKIVYDPIYRLPLSPIADGASPQPKPPKPWPGSDSGLAAWGDTDVTVGIIALVAVVASFAVFLFIGSPRP